MTVAHAIESPASKTTVAVVNPATSAGTDLAALTAEAAKLLVYPEQIELTTNRDSQTVVCQLVFENGITRDVTYETKWTIANPSVVRRSSNRLHPVSDGETQLTISPHFLS